MNNPKGETRFESDGNGYILKFNFNAFCELESAFGMSVQKIINKFNAKDGEPPDISLSEVRMMMRCGLNGGNARKQLYTDDEAGKIIDGLGGFLSAFDIITEAFVDAFSSGDENGKKPKGEATS